MTDHEPVGESVSREAVAAALDDVTASRDGVREAIETLVDAREEAGRSSAHDSLTEAFAALTTAKSMLSAEKQMREDSAEMDA